MSRVVFLTTNTPDTMKFETSLTCLGIEVSTIRIDNWPGLGEHAGLVGEVNIYAPDFVIYLGGLREFENGLSLKTIAELDHIAPTIHVVCDAAEPNWWPALRKYDDAQVFSATVSCDGSVGWPHFDTLKRSMTGLSPIDAGLYNPVPWADRRIPFGFAGSAGHSNGRKQIVLGCGDRLTVLGGSADRSYRAMCQWLCHVRVALNHSKSGSGAGEQVKGRVIEAALAGSILVESRGSAAAHWFKPGEMYLEYDTAEEALEQLYWVNANDAKAQEIARALTAEVHDKHLPKHFWGRAFELARSPR